MLPKIHKNSIPDRPVVNSIGSIIEKISAYIDEHLRPLVPRIPSYIYDKDLFFLKKMMMGKKLND